ncbi:MAG: AzlC family ABC transporter permease [Betaproteobacteria bacterium]|nr:AzlC family ABC transporter permease [Betaproteobacteria bacterium]
MDSPRSAFLAGARDQAPGVIGNIPFGLITGAAATAAGLDPLLAIAMSILTFAGAAQLVAIQLLADGAPALLIITAVAVVNLRMMMYSAAVAPLFATLSLRWKCVIGYLLTDHAFALTLARFGDGDAAAQPHRRWYYLGAGSLMWLVWQISVAVGALIGLKVPASWSLEFLIPLMFIALVAPALATRAHLAAAGTAAAVSLAAVSLPLKSGLLLAALAGVLGGLLVERFSRDPEVAAGP